MMGFCFFASDSASEMSPQPTTRLIRGYNLSYFRECDSGWAPRGNRKTGMAFADGDAIRHAE